MSDSEEGLGSFSSLSLGPPEISSDGCEVLVKYKVSGSIKCKQKSSDIVIQAPDDAEIADSVKRVEIKDPLKVDMDKLCGDKCLIKCATFPCTAGSKCSNDVFDVVEEHKGDSTFQDSMRKGCSLSASPYTRSVSLPTPAKLVSAMKGSREKLGAAPRNLTVTWAPDVYDPIPTSVSHVPKQKPQRYKSKRNGKNKQKGGSTRGKGKEKKQSRKSGGSSTKHYKLADNETNGAWYSKPRATSALDFGVGCPDPFSDSDCSEVLSGAPQASTLDFGVSNPDAFCGHSFLKKSVASMHFPVTEAT